MSNLSFYHIFSSALYYSAQTKVLQMRYHNIFKNIQLQLEVLSENVIEYTWKYT